ncbi:GNAT family N-acetyltransferase [Clostridium sp. 1001271B_151109_B4]|uniref:GNAT family N-acetyltransferase n=1 Tax=Clostridium sp. 1001271B_151109_B4 TaxID=2787148 RepID=UPI0018A8A1B2|nr:GNAT family N-acetyltransferase [Clostridium sp. 1001271B_151109_B4]
MDIKIRPIRIEDAEEINALRIMDGVRENILGITSERIYRSKNFISGLNNNAHMYVAEIIEDEGSKIIGTIGLHVSENPRLRHCGSIGIMVHKDYQQMGIGKKLMATVIDLADNWLMLKRLELGVFTDNVRALNLYKSFGFEIEGTKKCSAIRNGNYEDEYIMGRIRN